MLFTIGALIPATASADKHVPLNRLPPSHVLRAGELPRVPGGPPPQTIPLGVPDRGQLRRAKAQAAHEVAPEAERVPAPAEVTSEGEAPAPLAAVSEGLNKPGLCCGGIPPDPTGAIGPNHYLEFTNQSVGVFTRADLSQIAVVGHDNFMGGTGGGQKEGFHFPDPQIQWDPAANRWLFASVGLAGNSQVGFTFLLAFGWSKTADPLPLATSNAEEPGNWCRFYIDTGNELEDFPKLGHNDNHLIIGTNLFEEEGEIYEASVEGFLTARIWAIPKPGNGDTSCTTPAVFSTGTSESPLETADGDMAFTPVPANTFESASNGYIVAADSPFLVENPSQVMAWHLSGPAEAPTLSEDGNMDVSAFDFPANVPQPDSESVLDSLDARFTQAVARADPAVGETAVWTQHTVDGPEGPSVVRWYELLPQSSAVRQEGTISDPSNFAFNAAISPSSDGAGAAINYNLGGGSQLMQIRARSRHAATPLDQMVGEVLLREGAEAYPCGPGVCRWGDYAGASPDPANPSLVWGTNYTKQLFGGETRNFALFVEGVPPDTSIDSGPSGPTNVTTPTFTFSSTKQGSSFECRSDVAFFRACSGPGDSDTPTSQLPDGPHTFDVRATDSAGSTDPSPASRSFTVDTVAPAEPGFTATVPASPANDNTPLVRGTATEGTVRIYASADCSGSAAGEGSAASFAAPGIEVSVPDDSSTAFRATATDAAGNPSGCSTDSLPYTEDSTAPNTQIDSGPAEGATINDPGPTFEFSSGEPGTSFECRFDSEPFGACSGPDDSHTPSTDLDEGSHSFEVRASDEATNTDPSPASRSFTVDTVAPDTQIDSGPSGPTDDPTPTFSFSSDETASFECRLDGGAYFACSSPHTTAPLADGPHSFEVRATDQAGNTDPSSASRSFTVDAAASAPPASPLPDTTAPALAALPPALAALPPDTLPLTARLFAKRGQKGGRPIEIQVSCAEACAVAATGRVVVWGGPHRGAARVARRPKARFGLRRVARQLSAGQMATLKLRLKGKKAKRRLVRLLRRGRKAQAKIRVGYWDRAGNSKTARLTIRLRRG